MYGVLMRKKHRCSVLHHGRYQRNGTLKGIITAAGTKCVYCPGAMEHQLHVFYIAEALSVHLPHAASLK